MNLSEILMKMKKMFIAFFKYRLLSGSHIVSSSMCQVNQLEVHTHSVQITDRHNLKCEQFYLFVVSNFEQW